MDIASEESHRGEPPEEMTEESMGVAPEANKCPCCGAVMKEQSRTSRLVSYKCPDCGLADTKLLT